MTNLPNAPLIYTLGIVRFPGVPNIERFRDGFHDLIRGQYPSPEDITIPVMSATFGPEGLRMESHETRLFQFASPDKSWAFLLTNEILALHTVKYENHVDFADRFRFGLDALLQVPGIGIQWLEAVGMRYVDLVVPRPGEALSDYLRPWIVPSEAPNVSGGLTIKQGMYVATYRTNVGELRFQALRNPPTTLPPEIDTPVIQSNGWKREVPESDFVVMDSDHGCRFEPMIPMEPDTVCAKLIELRGIAKELFLASGTPHAMNVWKENS